MTLTIPRHQVLPVETVDVVIDPGPHPFEIEQGDAIEANWQQEKAANPALFDGRIALLSQLEYGDRRLVGRCHVVRYAAFLLWRGLRPVAGVEHSFAHAMPVGADGALIAIRMAAHTVNRGGVYFAAGSFEPEDFRDGRIDVLGNMLREVSEETGLDLGVLPADRIAHAYSSPQTGTVLFRRFFLPDPADAVAARIDAFCRADPAAEIAGAVVIRGPDDLPEGLLPHMLPLIRWHFETAAQNLEEPA